MQELVQQIVSSLGVSSEQAEGGAGLIMGILKDRLSSGDFSQLGNLLPGLDGLIDKAPNAPDSGLGGLIGGLAGALGGSDAGDLSRLLQGFSQLNLDSGMIGQFVSTIIEFLKKNGGDELTGVIANVLKGIGQ